MFQPDTEEPTKIALLGLGDTVFYKNGRYNHAFTTALSGSGIQHGYLFLSDTLRGVDHTRKTTKLEDIQTFITAVNTAQILPFQILGVLSRYDYAWADRGKFQHPKAKSDEPIHFNDALNALETKRWNSHKEKLEAYKNLLRDYGLEHYGSPNPQGASGEHAAGAAFKTLGTQTKKADWLAVGSRKIPPTNYAPVIKDAFAALGVYDIVTQLRGVNAKTLMLEQFLHHAPSSIQEVVMFDRHAENFRCLMEARLPSDTLHDDFRVTPVTTQARKSEQIPRYMEDIERYRAFGLNYVNQDSQGAIQSLFTETPLLACLPWTFIPNLIGEAALEKHYPFTDYRYPLLNMAKYSGHLLDDGHPVFGDVDDTGLMAQFRTVLSNDTISQNLLVPRFDAENPYSDTYNLIKLLFDHLLKNTDDYYGLFIGFKKLLSEHNYPVGRMLGELQLFYTRKMDVAGLAGIRFVMANRSSRDIKGDYDAVVTGRTVQPIDVADMQTGRFDTGIFRVDSLDAARSSFVHMLMLARFDKRADVIADLTRHYTSFNNFYEASKRLFAHAVGNMRKTRHLAEITPFVIAHSHLKNAAVFKSLEMLLIIAVRKGDVKFAEALVQRLDHDAHGKVLTDIYALSDRLRKLAAGKRQYLGENGNIGKTAASALPRAFRLNKYAAHCMEKCLRQAVATKVAAHTWQRSGRVGRTREAGRFRSTANAQRMLKLFLQTMDVVKERAHQPGDSVRHRSLQLDLAALTTLHRFLGKTQHMALTQTSMLYLLAKTLFEYIHPAGREIKTLAVAAREGSAKNIQAFITSMQPVLKSLCERIKFEMLQTMAREVVIRQIDSGARITDLRETIRQRLPATAADGRGRMRAPDIEFARGFDFDDAQLSDESDSAEPGSDGDKSGPECSG